MLKQNFKLYRSGIHLADISFNIDKIEYRYRDIYNNSWSDFKEYDKEVNIYKEKYSLDLVDIQNNLFKYTEIDFSNIKGFELKDKVYRKYKTVSPKSSNKDTYAVIWAQRHKKFPLDIVTIDNNIIGFIVTKREECIVLVKENYEKYTPQALWADTEISQDKYGIKYLGTHMVSMRDGVRLATDLWIPDTHEDTNGFPTIFIRTPYGKDRTFESQLRFVQRGYALVVQDTRGREASEGEFISKLYEREDGDDSLNWIEGQSWCDGNIGMIGASYLGYVQWSAASSSNPHLKAIVSIVTAGSPFIDLPRKGGTMSSGMLAWVFAMSKKEFWPEAMDRSDWDKVVKIRPIKDIPKKTLGREIKLWNKYMKHSTYDEFWDKTNWSTHGDKIKVPSLIMSGWFDDNGQGSLEAWNMNVKNNRSDIKMILGPWLHKANSTRDIGEIGFGNNSIRYDVDLLFLKWFDKYLKGIENGIDKGPAIEYYEQGNNQWKSSDTWTPKEAVRRKLYINSSGKANTSDGDGKLDWKMKFQSEYDTYVYNPKDPAPHLIDLRDNELNVPANYREVEKRQDVLVYTSEVLEEDLTIAGEIYGYIYAASSARDTDWVVRLTDVDTEGNSRRLVDGVYRARYINDFKEEKLLDKYEIRKYRINMFHTANTFKKGHKIRIEITSSAENLIFSNHNTGNDFALDIDYVIAKQKIYHSNEYPSFISLPILK